MMMDLRAEEEWTEILKFQNPNYFDNDTLQLLTRKQADAVRKAVHEKARAVVQEKRLEDEDVEEICRGIYKSIRIKFQVVDYHEIERSRFNDCIILIESLQKA